MHIMYDLCCLFCAVCMNILLVLIDKIGVQRNWVKLDTIKIVLPCSLLKLLKLLALFIVLLFLSKRRVP